jgi:hypothetical protein
MSEVLLYASKSERRAAGKSVGERASEGERGRGTETENERHTHTPKRKSALLPTWPAYVHPRRPEAASEQDLQGYLAHKKQRPPQLPTVVGTCLGPYTGPGGGGGLSYERGSPAERGGQGAAAEHTRQSSVHQGTSLIRRGTS